MAIILITGLPGHGKTLYALSRYRNVHEAPPKGEGRPVFHASGQADRTKRGEVHGIPGLVLPWEPFDPVSWAQLPPTALGIIDEAQFVFPLRAGRSEPPDYVAQLATHRHLGIDLVLITQHPKLIDPFVLRLVDQHFHVIRKFGTKFATIHEFTNGVRENVDKSRKDSIRHEWRYPKDVFDLYKSAEVHTVKMRIPARVWVMLALIPASIGLAALAMHRLSPGFFGSQAKEREKPAASQPGGSGTVAPIEPARPGRPELARWASFEPRVAGLPFTAPAYDRLTQPVEAPYPAYCVSMGPDYPCKCFTQRGTGLEVPRLTCDDIAKKGFFAYWVRPSSQAPAESASSAQQGTPAAAAAQPVAAASSPAVSPVPGAPG